MVVTLVLCRVLELLFLWPPGFGDVRSLRVWSPVWYGLCSCSVYNRDVAFPTLVGLAFSLRAVSLPPADTVGFSLC